MSWVQVTVRATVLPTLFAVDLPLAPFTVITGEEPEGRKDAR